MEAVQSGDHAVWSCNLHSAERERCGITGTTTWEDLDHEIWISDGTGEGKEDYRVDGVEAFFGYLAHQF